jgi:hypothetical protein
MNSLLASFRFCIRIFSCISFTFLLFSVRVTVYRLVRLSVRLITVFHFRARRRGLLYTLAFATTIVPNYFRTYMLDYATTIPLTQYYSMNDMLYECQL